MENEELEDKESENEELESEEIVEPYIEIEQLRYESEEGLCLQFNRAFNPHGFDIFRICIYDGFKLLNKLTFSGEQSLEMGMGIKTIVLNSIKEKTDIMTENAINSAFKEAKQDTKNDVI